ncbi:hypothetical protein FACS1894184_04420 [Clostridia bacterium]|nr:hypothetical protein FACS1894184_04420 [Clostridia bacterium]
MKQFTRLLSLLLAALVMVAAFGGVTVSAESAYPEYLNLDGYRPIVKDGSVTLSVLVRRDTIANSPIEDQWMVHFIQDVLGIKLDIEETFPDTYLERKNLMFAANDLKDFMFNPGLTAGEFVTYGMVEHMLLPISDYLTEELTPNILKTLADVPQSLPYNTLPDGKMYSLSNYEESFPGYGDTISYTRVWINTPWLEQVGLGTPTSLNEWLDMLRAFKTIDPASVGTPEVIPFIRTMAYEREFLFFPAFGWIGGGDDGVDAAIDVNTKQVVIPASEPNFAEYLKFMHTMYAEGLLHPDYFTMDRPTARALLAEGAAGAMAESAPYVSRPETYADFISAVPLTSDWNQQAAAMRSRAFGLGLFAISSATKYPEVCLRLLDYFYSQEGAVYSYFGPPAGDDTLGLVSGFKLNKTGDNFVMDDVINGKRESDYDYRVNSIIIAQSTPSDNRVRMLTALEMLGVENPQFRKMNLSDPDDFYRQMCYEAQNAYLVDGLPQVFLSDELSNRAIDLRTVIQAYVKSETAKFIVGQRSLDELPNYFTDLNSMGLTEYKQIYVDAYQSYIDSIR